MSLATYDENGQLLSQISSQPQQDTYPISQWEQALPIVVFYRLSAKGITVEKVYTREISLSSDDSTDVGQPGAKFPISFQLSPLFENQ